MTFWSDNKSSPKLSYRWMLTIGDSSNKIETYTVKSFQKPAFQIGVREYLNINDVGNKPGVLSWNPIPITLVDMEAKEQNNSSVLWKMLTKGGYVSTRDGLPAQAIVKNKIKQELGGQITFDYFSSEGSSDVIESWTLINPFVTQIGFGQANYASDEIMAISMTIQYDHARYKTES